VVNASNREKILAWLEAHKAGLAADVEDRTFETTMVAVQGPKAVEVVEGLFADDVTKLKYYFATPTRYREMPCVVSRTGYTGEDGFEVIVPKAAGITLWEEFLGRGAVPCGLGARDTLRLEAAMPLYGHELNETITPLQAGLGWAVKPDKGEFIGRAALLKPDPAKPVRVGLEVEGKRAAREGSALLDADGKPAGTVTSGSFCPWLDKSLAMAYVRPELAAVGTPLDVDARGSTLTATVVPLPFYKRSK
jgi:aminomethyltransferase